LVAYVAIIEIPGPIYQGTGRPADVIETNAGIQGNISCITGEVCDGVLDLDRYL